MEVLFSAGIIRKPISCSPFSTLFFTFRFSRSKLSAKCTNSKFFSTRGLDSANALEFCANLRLAADMFHSTILVSLYQGSEDTYEARKLNVYLLHMITDTGPDF